MNTSPLNGWGVSFLYHLALDFRRFSLFIFFWASQVSSSACAFFSAFGLIFFFVATARVLLLRACLLLAQTAPTKTCTYMCFSSCQKAALGFFAASVLFLASSANFSYWQTLPPRVHVLAGKHFAFSAHFAGGRESDVKNIHNNFKISSVAYTACPKAIIITRSHGVYEILLFRV